MMRRVETHSPAELLLHETTRPIVDRRLGLAVGSATAPSLYLSHLERGDNSLETLAPRVEHLATFYSNGRTMGVMPIRVREVFT
jgi:hypothetical protein